MGFVGSRSHAGVVAEGATIRGVLGRPKGHSLRNQARTASQAVDPSLGQRTQERISASTCSSLDGS
jgi:hypothetical protein